MILRRILRKSTAMLMVEPTVAAGRRLTTLLSPKITITLSSCCPLEVQPSSATHLLKATSLIKPAAGTVRLLSLIGTFQRCTSSECRSIVQPEDPCIMYARPSFIGYSLWLIPKEPVKSSLQGIIDRYSSEHSTVSFEPHVTLLAGVEPKGGVGEIISKTEKLASDLKVLPARVERTACKDLYFQSVFALLTTDEALLEAHKTARALFGQDPDGANDYMPHVSLLYGDLPMATREAIRQDTEPALIGSEFELDHLQVWSTKGVVTEWTLLRTFPLREP